MATLNATNLKHASSGSNNIVLAADGSTTISNLSGGVGKILQVLQTVKTDVFSTNSSSYVAVTGLTQAITAASTSNKILVNVTLYGGNSGSDYAVGFKLAKDGSAIDGNLSLIHI